MTATGGQAQVRVPGLARLSVATFIMATAFVVHVLNGLVIERLVLDLRRFQDYADVDLLARAINSVPWRASGLGPF